MERMLRAFLMIIVIFLVLSAFVGLIALGLSILFPFLLAMLVLYGIFYIYQKSRFLQKLFGKSKLKKSGHASGVTTYYEIDQYGNQKESKTIVEIYEDDKK